MNTDVRRKKRRTINLVSTGGVASAQSGGKSAASKEGGESYRIGRVKSSVVVHALSDGFPEWPKGYVG